MREKFKNNQQGFTLVELIIVIAIIAILATALVFSTSLVTRTRIREAATNFNTLLSDARIQTMSGKKEEGSILVIKLTVDNSQGVVANVESNGVIYSSEVLGDAGIPVVVSVDGTEDILSDGESIYLAFEQKTGAFKPLNEIPQNAGVYDSNKRVDYVLFGTGENVYQVDLTFTTGYHEVN